MFSLEKRPLREDLFKYLKDCNMEEGTNWFQTVSKNRTRSNGYKLQEKIFRLDIRKKFLTIRWFSRGSGCSLKILTGSTGMLKKLEKDFLIKSGQVGLPELVGTFKLYD